MYEFVDYLDTVLCDENQGSKCGKRDITKEKPVFHEPVRFFLLDICFKMFNDFIFHNSTELIDEDIMNYSDWSKVKSLMPEKQLDYYKTPNQFRGEVLNSTF